MSLTCRSFPSIAPTLTDPDPTAIDLVVRKSRMRTAHRLTHKMHTRAAPSRRCGRHPAQHRAKSWLPVGAPSIATPFSTARPSRMRGTPASSVDPARTCAAARLGGMEPLSASTPSSGVCCWPRWRRDVRARIDEYPSITTCPARRHLSAVRGAYARLRSG